MMAQLTAALSTLSAEYVRTAPPEVFRVFPDFAAELADMLTSSTVEQLVDVTASLESEASSIAVDHKTIPTPGPVCVAGARGGGG